MSLDKQCLQRDITEENFSRRGCGKNLLDVCEVMSCDEYVAVVMIEKRITAQLTCCYTVTFATKSLLRRSAVPAKFLLGTSTRSLQKRETPNALVVVCSGNEA